MNNWISVDTGVPQADDDKEYVLRYLPNTGVIRGVLYKIGYVIMGKFIQQDTKWHDLIRDEFTLTHYQIIEPLPESPEDK